MEGPEALFLIKNNFKRIVNRFNGLGGLLTRR